MKKPIIFLIGTMIFCILLPVLISVLFYGKNEVASSEIAKKITQKSEQKKAVKKKASEETENWADWNGFDDNDL